MMRHKSGEISPERKEQQRKNNLRAVGIANPWKSGPEELKFHQSGRRDSHSSVEERVCTSGTGRSKGVLGRLVGKRSFRTTRSSPGSDKTARRDGERGHYNHAAKLSRNMGETHLPGANRLVTARDRLSQKRTVTERQTRIWGELVGAAPNRRLLSLRCRWVNNCELRTE